MVTFLFYLKFYLEKKKVFIGHGVGRTNIVLIFNRYQNSKFMLEYVCWSDLRGE